MRIGFSARGLSTPSGGVHQFIKCIIPALARQIKDDELFVFYNNSKFLGLAENCSEIVIKGNNKLVWDFLFLPRIIRKMKLDAVIFPKNVLAFFTSCQRYVVHHDLGYFDRKLNAYKFLDNIYMRLMIPISDRKADGIFSVSENTKKDIVKYCKTNPDKITVTYEAAGGEFKPITDNAILEQIKEKYGLPEKFILYTGSLSPRKNIQTLLKAFSQICEKIPHKLVLTASKSWKDSDVYKTINMLGLEDKIKKLGYVEQEDMPVLYNLADIYVYPSLYEGFGLPILEAMQCGCPVVASNATSIPEVAGEAGLLLEPLDVNGFAQTIYNVLTDNNIRKKLVDSGLKQAEKFSWDKTAEKMLNVIRNNCSI